MKWLILLILISCGKHEEPGALDLRDSDGDQTLNYEESPGEKYIANYEPLGKFRGVLKFYDNGQVELPFENSKTENAGLKILVSNSLKVEDYFSEWSELSFSKSYTMIEKEKQILAYLNFDTTSEVPDEVVLQTGKEQINLGKWSLDMGIKLSPENMGLLTSGKARISLRKKFKRGNFFKEDADATIRQKTYRVKIFNGEKAETFYVSRELSFEDFLKLKDISQHQKVVSDDIFFYSYSIQKEWFIRDLSNGDKIIAFTDRNEIKKNYLTENFVHTSTVLTRENGTPQTGTFKFKNAGGKVFMYIRNIQQTNRTFVESTDRRRYTFGGGALNGNGPEIYYCTHYLRKIAGEVLSSPGINAVLENVSLTVENRPDILLPLPAMDVVTMQDEKEMFWGVYFDAPAENIKLSLNPRSSSTYTVTGEYTHRCDQKPERTIDSAYTTNTEGKFSFVVETFVEKI